MLANGPYWPIFLHLGVTLDALVISPDSVGLIVGATQQLAVQGFWSNGFIANIDAATAAYSGNDAGVATVTTGGLVTAVAVGSTSVTVSYTVAGTSSEVSSNPVPITAAQPVPVEQDPAARSHFVGLRCLRLTERLTFPAVRVARASAMVPTAVRAQADARSSASKAHLN